VLLRLKDDRRREWIRQAVRTLAASTRWLLRKDDAARRAGNCYNFGRVYDARGIGIGDSTPLLSTRDGSPIGNDGDGSGCSLLFCTAWTQFWQRYRGSLQQLGFGGTF
jgi:hypothetical protein